MNLPVVLVNLNICAHLGVYWASWRLLLCIHTISPHLRKQIQSVLLLLRCAARGHFGLNWFLWLFHVSWLIIDILGSVSAVRGCCLCHLKVTQSGESWSAALLWSLCLSELRRLKESSSVQTACYYQAPMWSHTVTVGSGIFDWMGRWTSLGIIKGGLTMIM